MALFVIGQNIIIGKNIIIGQVMLNVFLGEVCLGIERKRPLVFNLFLLSDAVHLLDTHQLLQAYGRL